MQDARRRLEALYAAFNARDIDATLAGMHPDVDWANGLEGGSVHGHAAVRDYWTRQWQQIDPHVEPVGFAIGTSGEVVVDVHQIVCDRAGHVRSDQRVQHIYLLEKGLIRRMRIRKQAAPGFAPSRQD